MRAEIPDKLYFRIGEVSKLASLEPHVLRYWEKEFKEIRPKRANSNQRLYRRVDVETVLKIKNLLYEQGLTISGAKKFLKGQQSTSEEVKKTVLSQPHMFVDRIKEELKSIESLLLNRK